MESLGRIISAGLCAALLAAFMPGACAPRPASEPATHDPGGPAAGGPAPGLIPDEEADSLPTLNGVPLVPLLAPVNFLDPLEPRPVYRMPREYNTNHTAVQIIKEEETLQLTAYELGGVWLIGYGHLMLEGEKSTITPEEAEAFLREDLHWCESAIERYVTVPVTLNEFSAMVAFCYNVGSGKTRTSSVVRKVNIDDRPGAADSFLLWNRMNGVIMSALANRRARERTLFITP